MEQKPTLGRIVNVRLSAHQVEAINERRNLHRAVGDDECNGVKEGQIVPAMVVAVWSHTCISVQMFLDGPDTQWATSLHLGNENGNWHWPARV